MSLLVGLARKAAARGAQDAAARVNAESDLRAEARGARLLIRGGPDAEDARRRWPGMWIRSLLK